MSENSMKSSTDVVNENNLLRSTLWHIKSILVESSDRVKNDDIYQRILDVTDNGLKFVTSTRPSSISSSGDSTSSTGETTRVNSQPTEESRGRKRGRDEITRDSKDGKSEKSRSRSPNAITTPPAKRSLNNDDVAREKAAEPKKLEGGPIFRALDNYVCLISSTTNSAVFGLRYLESFLSDRYGFASVAVVPKLGPIAIFRSARGMVKATSDWHELEKRFNVGTVFTRLQVGFSFKVSDCLGCTVGSGSAALTPINTASRDDIAQLPRTPNASCRTICMLIYPSFIEPGEEWVDTFLRDAFEDCGTVEAYEFVEALSSPGKDHLNVTFTTSESASKAASFGWKRIHDSASVTVITWLQRWNHSTEKEIARRGHFLLGRNVSS